MASIKTENGTNLFLISDDSKRVFLPSDNINVFPCSRRGRSVDSTGKYYDPEARLNTERTNRLHTALNGFTDSFIEKEYDSTKNSLVFVLAGYRVEVKNFIPSGIADAIGATSAIYAHLGIQGGISLNVEDYFTEILYRQLADVDDTKTKYKYLDVSCTAKDADKVTSTHTDYFFAGISFTGDTSTISDNNVTSHFLKLFSNVGNNWVLEQTSLLPKIEHGETEDSIKLSGTFTVKNSEQISFEIVKPETGPGGHATVNVPLHSTKGLIVGEKAEDDVFSDGTIKAKEHIETPTLEATTKIDTPLLNVTDNDNAGQANIDKAVINDTLTVVGETSLQSNLYVEDNINVGTPVTPATADNGGYIVAKKDITAEQDLIAKRDIKATKKVTAESLVVGERTSGDSTEAGTIIAKTLVKTPALEATSVDVDSITSDATDGLVIYPKAKINNTLEVIDTATLNNGLAVTNGNTILKGLSADETKLDNLAIAGEAASDSVLTVNGKTTVDADLAVFGTTSTPTLKVDTITTNANSEITVENQLNVTGKTILTDELEVTKKATLKNGLKVANGDTDLRKLATTELKVADNVLTVTKDDAKFTKPVTVDSSLTSNNVQIKDKGQVPALELAQLTDDSYQLRFKFGTKLEIKDERPKTTE